MSKRLVFAGLLIMLVSGCATTSPEKRAENLAEFIATLPSCAACKQGDCTVEQVTAPARVAPIVPPPPPAARPAVPIPLASPPPIVQKALPPVTTIVVSSEVLFAVNSAKLKPAATQVLAGLIGDLGLYPNEQITVVGHTDSTGTASYNKKLSKRRAQAVVDALVSRGVDSTRIRAVGKGEAEPKADNATAAGRKLNRRVEIEMRPGK